MKWIFYTEISETNKQVTDCHICYMMNRQTHVYEYVQSHIITLHQHVYVIPVTMIRVSYSKITNIIQIAVQPLAILMMSPCHPLS